MKKFVNKFFGIDEHGMNGIKCCGWNILCQFMHGLLIAANEATVALMVLKLIGSITIGWGVVLLPAVIRAVFKVIESMVNSKIIKINDKLRKAYYEELMKKAAMENSEDDDRFYVIE